LAPIGVQLGERAGEVVERAADDLDVVGAKEVAREDGFGGQVWARSKSRGFFK